jgi:hypothetical protein
VGLHHLQRHPPTDEQVGALVIKGTPVNERGPDWHLLNYGPDKMTEESEAIFQGTKREGNGLAAPFIVADLENDFLAVIVLEVPALNRNNVDAGLLDPGPIVGLILPWFREESHGLLPVR